MSTPITHQEFEVSQREARRVAQVCHESPRGSYKHIHTAFAQHLTPSSPALHCSLPDVGITVPVKCVRALDKVSLAGEKAGAWVLVWGLRLCGWGKVESAYQ
jgi:hypothetical protein